MKQKSKGVYQNHLKKMKAKVADEIEKREERDDWFHNGLGFLWAVGIVFAILLFIS